jgi:hypothetical protein
VLTHPTELINHWQNEVVPKRLIQKFIDCPIRRIIRWIDLQKITQPRTSEWFRRFERTRHNRDGIHEALDISSSQLDARYPSGSLASFFDSRDFDRS